MCKLERRSILQLQVWWLEPKAKPGAKTHFDLNVGMYDRIETQPGLGVLLREPKGNNLLVAKLEYLYIPDSYRLSSSNSDCSDKLTNKPFSSTYNELKTWNVVNPFGVPTSTLVHS